MDDTLPIADSAPADEIVVSAPRTDVADEVAVTPPDPAPVKSVEAVATTAPTSRWLWPLAILVALLFAAFFLIEPTVQYLRPTYPRFRLATSPELSVVLSQRVLEGLTFVWFFMFGASLGSFLHCLEYRWPRHISVVARGSSCPGCGAHIKLQHNVPVFGWLWLRGRCSNCGWTIPPRYALTEFAFGLVFVVLMAVELMGAGVNLPLTRTLGPLGVVENIWDPDWPLLGYFAYHALLLIFLLTASLFAWDRFRLPLGLVSLFVTIAIVAPMVWPGLQVIGADGTILRLPIAAGIAARWQVAMGISLGGLAGLFVGGCLARRTPGNIRSGDSAASILGMLMVGICLGWQAVIGVGLICVMLRALLLPTLARSWPVVATIMLATLIHLCLWAWLMKQPFWPGPSAYLLTSLSWLGFVAVLALVLDSQERGGDAATPVIVMPSTEPAAGSAVPTRR